MLLTSLASFLEDSKTYQTVPVVSHIFADTLTPIQIFQQLEGEATFLLESKDEQSPWSRYSFIGLHSFLYLIEREGSYFLKDDDNNIILKGETLTDVFENALHFVNVKPLDDIPIPFRGGAVGYVSYDAIRHFEPIINRVNDNEKKEVSESVHLVFCKTIISYDHTKKEIYMIELPRVKNDIEQNKAVFAAAKGKHEGLVEKIFHERRQQKIISPPKEARDVSFAQVRSNYKKEKFIEDVKLIKEYIRAGDIFQAVLSQRFECDISVSGLDVYRVLRMINPSPYLFYLKLGEHEIVGSSPERLVQIQDSHVEIHPIAGTRHRGKTAEEDNRLAEELLQDKKERAEHYMLVDLARNDIGRIATPGSIETPVLMEIGKFSHVMHIISKVTGKLSEQVKPIEALIASFPAGTVSGAPKIRAMEILQEIEPTERGIYAGAIGYFGYDGNIDSCIAIRTMIIKNNKAYVQAGAGIVADSVPEKEWEETRNKAKALIKAIEMAETMFEASKEGSADV